MLQLQYEIGPRTHTTVSPHVVVRSALLELDYLDLSRRIEQEIAENPALDVDLDNSDYEPLPVGLPPSAQPLAPSTPDLAGAALPMSSLPAPQSLQDELVWQLHATAPASLHEIGEILISVMDDDGYLDLDTFELAEDLDVPLAQVKWALDHVQQLSPPGVGARSLRECLQLQIRAKRENNEPVPDEVVRVVDHFAACHEDNIEEQLGQATGLTLEQVRAALDDIRRNFHPYPGQQFRSHILQPHTDQHIYPDAIIYYDGEDLQVDIPQSQSTALCLNGAYLRLERLLKRQQASTSCAELSDMDPTQVQDIQEQIGRARCFIQMLEQRRATMQRITEAIVEHQEGLILRGVMALRPLTKKQIARQTQMHESTVSRATRNKYVMLPAGQLLPFDLFFEDALPIKALMLQTIQQEDPERSLTDKQLEQILARYGYRLARRTVTKYRHQMGIPSSRRRGGAFKLTCAEFLP